MKSSVPAFFDTDKIEPHGYFPVYLRLASELGPFATVCELGVEDGESLRMWQALFPCGTVLGVDISRKAHWPAGTLGLISAQDDPQLPVVISEMHGIKTFDLIVDDASHHGIATRKSFELLFPLVRPGGYYVIEDWQVSLCGDPSGRGPEAWGPSMLRTAEGFLKLLDSRDADIDQITYRYGLIIIQRSANGRAARHDPDKGSQDSVRAAAQVV